MPIGAATPDESVNFSTRKLLAVPFVGWLIADQGTGVFVAPCADQAPSPRSPQDDPRQPNPKDSGASLVSRARVASTGVCSLRWSLVALMRAIQRFDDPVPSGFEWLSPCANPTPRLWPHRPQRPQMLPMWRIWRPPATHTVGMWPVWPYVWPIIAVAAVFMDHRGPATKRSPPDPRRLSAKR